MNAIRRGHFRINPKIEFSRDETTFSFSKDSKNRIQKLHPARRRLEQNAQTLAEPVAPESFNSHRPFIQNSVIGSIVAAAYAQQSRTFRLWGFLLSGREWLLTANSQSVLVSGSLKRSKIGGGGGGESSPTFPNEPRSHIGACFHSRAEWPLLALT